MLSYDVETHARTVTFCQALPVDESYLRDCLVYSELMDEPYVMLYWPLGRDVVLGVVIKNDLARGLTTVMGLAIAGRLPRSCLNSIGLEDIAAADIGSDHSYVIISCSEGECCERLNALSARGCAIHLVPDVRASCITALTLEELLGKLKSTVSSSLIE